MKRLTRREWLKAMGGGAAGLWLAACQPAVAPPPTSPAEPTPAAPEPTATTPPAEGGSIEAGPVVDGIRVTANADFYSVFAFVPEVTVDQETWRLRVFGNVKKELNLSPAEIKAMPAVTEMRTLECISNPVGGDLISNAVWEGIRMADLLKQAGVKPDTTELAVRSADEFHTAIPIELAQDERSLLVYTMNGEPLPVKHGAPLRALWSGRYGMKQPKWIASIEAISGHHLGYWERQGWSNDAFIKPNSQIERPRSGEEITAKPYRISGRAFAGRSGVAKVEVSVNDGRTWHEATLTRVQTEEFQPYVWTLWHWDWENPLGDRATIQARVTDGAGAAQTDSGGRFLSNVFPDGTDAIHQVIVKVKI
jgi:DMSO/TMAO reductase YedYZ molybdopterin-dependent catalytic subunit